MLVPILLEDNGAGLLECIRVYGNLSQDAEVRKLIIEKKSECSCEVNRYIIQVRNDLVDQLLLLLLDSESRDLVYSSCGVLINLTADHMYRSILSNNTAVGRSVPPSVLSTLELSVCLDNNTIFIITICIHVCQCACVRMYNTHTERY